MSRGSMDGGSGKALFRAEPLPTRRHYGRRSGGTADQLWTRLRDALPPPPNHWQRDRLDADAALRSLLAGDPPPTMTPADAFRLYDRMVGAEYGDRGDAWTWRGARQSAFADRMETFAHWLVASRGGVTAVGAADLVRLARESGRSPSCRTAWHDPLSLGLRAAFAAAPPAAYDAARDAALSLAGATDWAVRAFFAFLLADDGPAPHALQPGAVLAEAVRAGVDPAREPKLIPLLADMRPSAAAAWRGHRRGLLLLESVQVDPARLAATVAAVAARHAEPSGPTLFWLYHQAKGDDQGVFARALLASREDDAVARLLPDLDRKPVRAALNRAASADPAWTLRRCLALLAAGRGGSTMEHRLREMVDQHGVEAARRWCAGMEAAATARLEALAAPPAVALARPEDLPAFLNVAPIDASRSAFPLPGWFIPANLCRPALVAGGALPDGAVSLVAEMLALSSRVTIHPGLDALKGCCTADSLGTFAWDLFSAWLARGGPGQDPWAVRAVGWLGDESCVRRLAAQIRRWLDMRARAQAAMGIEALADMGSDAALNSLADLAARLGSKSLRAKAARHLAEAAAARGLDADRLADRLAPDLGLDARGGLDLDFGARRFRAELDASLRPVLRDAAGRMLKDLPRPTKADDADRAAAAAALWAALKRAARAAAGPQLARLEAMMASGRRVAPDLFRAWFADHPLVGRPARHLVWSRHERRAEAAPLAFIVAGSGELLDAHGCAVALDGAGGDEIGLVHPLDLPQGERAAWRRHFHQLAVAQPFPQLERDVHILSSAERQSVSLHRVQGIEVPAGWLRGMVAHGWPFGRAQEEGLMWWIERAVALSDGSPGIVRLAFAPGLRIGTPEPDEGPRTLAELDLFALPTRDEAVPAVFGRIDPVTASELIHSVTRLAGRGTHPTPSAWAVARGEPPVVH